MVQLAKLMIVVGVVTVSMPHAALWVVQPLISKKCKTLQLVSMPHAALWVVQHVVGRKHF